MFVAIKICVSKTTHNNRELAVLRAIVAARSNQPGYEYLMTMQDYFQIHGPNGTHDCLVTELLGPSVADFLDGHSGLTRIPEPLAKTIAKQTLTGLSFLHEHNMSHADLHTRNLAFTLPASHEQDLLQKLGETKTAPVQRTDRHPLEPNFPTYLVRPAAYPINPQTSFTSIKLIDYGQSFLSNNPPTTLNTPLYYRTREALSNDPLDHRVDLWSMGCLFELTTAQPPFTTFLITPPTLASQILELTGDTSPHRWQEQWQVMSPKQPGGDEERSLQRWLEELYFYGEQKRDLSKEDVKSVGRVIGSMLRLEPEDRASAMSVLGDEWFLQGRRQVAL